MKNHVTELIHIDTSLAIPVYKQIVQSICRNIENGVLAKDDVLPSVNKIAETFSLARGSVFTAYNDLRASGIIDSIPGKGYFVSGTETKQHKRIFLLFSTFSAYKEILYNTLLESLPTTCTLHIYFHQHNIKTFESLIREQAGHYNIFIIMPLIHPDTSSILSKLDPKRTFLLDVGYKEYRKEYAGVFENFEKDIYTILVSIQQLVSKYKRLILVIPESIQTKELVSGFNKFSKKTAITTAIKNNIVADDVKKGTAFIVLDDKHLVALIKQTKINNWQLGKDIGILSYNETLLKSVIGEGITTITTDWEAMGRSMAEMVLTGKRAAIENSFVMIDRKSI